MEWAKNPRQWESTKQLLCPNYLAHAPCIRAMASTSERRSVYVRTKVRPTTHHMQLTSSRAERRAVRRLCCGIFETPQFLSKVITPNQKLRTSRRTSNMPTGCEPISCTCPPPPSPRFLSLALFPSDFPFLTEEDRLEQHVENDVLQASESWRSSPRHRFWRGQ